MKKNQDLKNLDDGTRFLLYEEDCALNYGYNKIELHCGKTLTYTSMIKPECFEQYKNGKITIKETINLNQIKSIDNIFNTKQSQEYFNLFINSEKSAELKRVKLLREKSPLNLVLNPIQNMTSLEVICRENNEKKQT